MASNESFKPGAGGLQVSVVGGPGSRELGKNFALGSPAPAAPLLSQGAVPQIGQQTSPKGAQPVSLMGAPIQQQSVLGQQAAAVPAPPRMPLSPGAQPQHMLGKPQGASMDGEVHTVIVEGLAPDGKKYYAEYDAVFPKGTKVLGVTENLRS